MVFYDSKKCIKRCTNSFHYFRTNRKFIKTLEIRKNASFPKAKNDELLTIIKKCDGIGISGANENSNSVLNHYSKTTKIRAIHSAETKQSTSKSKKITGKSETIRALQ